MFEKMVIASHRGPYSVSFDDEAFAQLDSGVDSKSHYIVDANVAKIYGSEIGKVLSAPSVLVIEASEISKSLDQFGGYIEHLISTGVRRGHHLVAIGGGVIQDITCFLAATLLRGLPWRFVPTTLLAQADSCIGSKSSINVGKSKNILGTFTPPVEIVISTRVLRSLDDREIRSGVGEMLKVHVIDGPDSFDRIAADYSKLFDDFNVMRRYIRDSLAIKKRFVEEDEFDRGVRNVMNYGHSFGHAIESATDFAVPHGIAVTMGMDMANYVAVNLGLMGNQHYDRMHFALRANYAGFERVAIPASLFFNALARDKKNKDSELGLILPGADARVARGFYQNDHEFQHICGQYLSTQRLL